MASDLYLYTYMGSKLRMVQEIEYMSPLDARELYEVCGGLGAFIINQHSLYEKAVYNELNPLIYNLMHVLKYRGNDYIGRVVDIVCDKAMFSKLKKQYNNNFNGLSDVERAVALSFLQIHSYNGNRIAFAEKPRSLDWGKNTKKRLERVSEELQNIELENRDCMDILNEQKYNQNAFVFMDIPYPMDTEIVTKAIYEDYDWADSMHESAVRLLRDMDGRNGCKVMVCTYQSEIYDSLLDTGHWMRVQIKDVPSPAGKKGQKKKRKIECVYLNYSSYSPLAKYHFDIDDSRQSRQK